MITNTEGLQVLRKLLDQVDNDALASRVRVLAVTVEFRTLAQGVTNET